jgi:hypothetical protein
MVDLGRGGLIKEAVDMIKSMPWEPNDVKWGAKVCHGSPMRSCGDPFSACILHKNVEYVCRTGSGRVEQAAALSNIYAETGQWSDMAKARMPMKGSLRR